MVKKTADKCAAALLVLAALVWAFDIGADSDAGAESPQIAVPTLNN